MGKACFPINNLELQIRVKGDSAFGDSYHYLDVDNYIKKNFVGSYNAASKSLVLQEALVTTYKIPTRCVVCIKKYSLQYSREGNKEILTGTWTGNIMDTNVECGPGTLILTRIKESFFKEAPEITVDTGTIRLDFYDNGTVDGDSITVLVNKKVILTHQKLTAKPVTAFIRIDEANTFQEIEMLGENLGSIPPNTALLIVTAGTKRYRLDLSSTETKAAKVRFVFNKGATILPDMETTSH